MFLTTLHCIDKNLILTNLHAEKFAYAYNLGIKLKQINYGM